MPELPPRVLSPSESVFVISGATVAQHCYGTGPLDDAALKEALAGMVDLYPLLGGRIHMSRRGFELRFDPRERPEVVFQDVGDADVGDYVVAGKAALPFGQVCALRVCRSGAKFRVTLLLHHAIADADAAMAYLHDVWQLYTERTRRVNGVVGLISTPAPHPIPASAETLLRARGYIEPAYRQMMDLRPAYRGPESIWTALRPRRAQRARIQLSVEQTDRLVEAGRAQGVTLNGLVSAALVLAERELSGKSELSVAISSFVNLRSRIDPPVAPTEGTNVLGIAEMILDVNRGSAALDLARRVVADIRDGLRTTRIHQSAFVRGDFRRALALVRQYFLLVPMAGLVPTFTAIQITNWGRVSAFATPDGVDIHDFRCGVELHPLSAAIATRGVAMVEGRIYFVTSYNGRLSIDFTKLDTRKNDARRVEQILHTEIEKLIPAMVFE
ncbi:phthiocerol/phthiodiolone dimycocerosyl transferase family protein [Mycobacteroides salmoniphilum]|uniref:phthiocerol/phthiodiolone dimycocerosyl transferase family protein n=1 Tax=Mycobacteroides salmoniphilum TaxID=404941 RepID=UPI00106483D7|nr:acyltransferase [Mycobacteroides salmoniphilum]TDZ92754.1 Phthiocerol/phthiodiolone dimycocerosyl transferase [Mycobacteroides salmoniphilum]